MKRIPSTQFADLLLSGRRLIDVRAPVEYADGAIPGAVNLPLLNDEERREIGIIYKEKGQAAAVERGHSLISGATREERIQAWVQVAKNDPDCVVYCFRGGLRSQIVQSWMAANGIEIPIVEGGYKALRRFLIEATENILKESLKFEVICGPTGSGKTEFLNKSGKPFLDLEALAKHRGSAFGAMNVPQPSQIDFENAIALELLRLSRKADTVLVEDESRMIGKCCLPETLFTILQTSSKVLINVGIDQRVENIYRDYILESALGKESDSKVFESFRKSVQSISKRLGGLRTTEILRDLDSAQRDFESGRGLDSNRIWIRKLLEWYYDPVYFRALSQKEKAPKS